MRLAWCVLIASAVGADALKRRAKGAAPPPTASERFVSSLKAGDLRTAFKVSPRAYADWWTALAQEAPQHVAVESVLLVMIAWLLLGMKKSDSREEPLSQLSKREIEELVEEWQPEPLVPAAPDADDEPGEVIQSFDGATVTVSGSKKKLNMAGFDFLGLRSAPQPREAADAALRKYGCGSCGPRGFYGTIDVHAALETSLAKFLVRSRRVAPPPPPPRLSRRTVSRSGSRSCMHALSRSTSRARSRRESIRQSCSAIRRRR